METVQLKKDLHKLIDDFSDTKMLEQLTHDQQRRLAASLKQAGDGETVSHDEVAWRAKEWLSK